MRRALLTIVVLLLTARGAAAQDVAARALVGYERHDLGTQTTAGLRQTYDFRLSKALTMTSIVRLFFRGDDFQTNGETLGTRQNHTRQLQPGGEILINTMNLHGSARSEYFDTTTRSGMSDSTRRLSRTSGQLTWDPASLPTFLIRGQRNNTTDSASDFRLNDQSGYGSMQYDWRAFHAGGGERYARTTDPQIGFDRRTTTHEANLGYNSTGFNGKLSVIADASAQRSKIDERAIGIGQSAVATPVTISRALYGVDDTPSDDRDHPLMPYPLLIDGNFDTPAGIFLSPDAVSFQNIGLDFGRVDRVDEIRILVRDAAGNPLRNGGGPVQWDLYSSEDGILWTPQSSQTTFNATLSLYSVTFTQATGRWFKIVNFGVNADPTFVSEVQAFYHTAIRVPRSGFQNYYNGMATVTLQPVQRFLMSYTGTYTSSRQELTSLPIDRSDNVEHLANVQYDVRKWLTLRSQVYKRTVTAFNTSDGDADGLSAYLDLKPTRQLQVTLENSRQNQTISNQVATIDTRAVHTTAFIVKSFAVNLDVGKQDETVIGTTATAHRTYLTLVGNAQLYPTLRMLLTASLQKNATDSTTEATQLLGPSKDNRVYADFIWRPGPQLTLSSRLGWLSSDALTGFTQRYHGEWHPFGDGTVALAGAFDDDIDPVTDRRARRIILNPRWLMNRWTILDLNYTSISTTFPNGSLRQRTFYATLTLTK